MNGVKIMNFIDRSSIQEEEDVIHSLLEVVVWCYIFWVFDEYAIKEYSVMKYALAGANIMHY